MDIRINIYQTLYFQSSSNNPAWENNSSSNSNSETNDVNEKIDSDEPLEEIICEICEPLDGIMCEICAETKETTKMVKNNTCDHSYCSDCMTKHVATKIQDNITVVPCPGLNCKTVYEMKACQPWIPKDLLERWDTALL